MLLQAAAELAENITSDISHLYLLLLQRRMMRADFVGQKAKTMSTNRVKSSVELRITAEFVGSALLATPFFKIYIIIIFILCLFYREKYCI